MSIETAAVDLPKPKSASVFATGMALFSMFFGAGNIVFPLLIGKGAGNENGSALLGLGVSAVAFPFLGLIAMMMYGGDLKAFLARLGKWPAIAMMFILFMSQGPVSAMPRLITLMHASVKPYIPISLSLFSVLVAALIFWMTVRPQRMVQLLGVFLTPVLLGTLAILVILGLYNAESPLTVPEGGFYHFCQGLKGGYQTLDLMAALLFTSVIMPYLSKGIASSSAVETSRRIRRRMLGASAIAAALLMITYIGLSQVAAHHAHTLGEGIESVDLLYALAAKVLGPWGGFVAASAIFLACLTTAISLAAVFSDYLRAEWLKNKLPAWATLALTLSASAAMATIGFSGIMKIVGPALEILYPALIVLCLLNIAHRLYEVRPLKGPVFATLAIGSLGFWMG